jgi:hypothetical protein
MQIDERVHHRLGLECRSETAAAHSPHAQLGILLRVAAWATLRVTSVR